jgi:hypothetical protein
MRVRSEPLTWYADKLNRGETFSLARYGDGELYCMRGREGKNCDGCDYTPELAAALRASLLRAEPDFFYGLQRVWPHDREEYARLLEEVGAPQREWLDSGVIAHAVIDGTFYPLLNALRRLETVIVSNAGARAVRPLLPYSHFVETPAGNAFAEKDRIRDDVLKYGKPACYLFSCGMTACVLVDELHGRIPGSWFLDVGHVWDVFLGKNTRYYMASMTPEQVARNLRP